jgi:hypothetical protein
LPQPPHDEFLALCALSTSGELTGDEQKLLQEHLTGCPSCRQAMRQYQAVVQETIPALAADGEIIESDSSWSQELAEAALFQQMTLQDELGRDRGCTDRELASKAIGRVPLSASQTVWRNVWALCAAGVLLCVALGVSAYQVGIRRGPTSSISPPPASQKNQWALEEQVSDAAHEREALRAQMTERDQAIADLRRQLEQRTAEIGRMRLAQSRLEAGLQNGQASRDELVLQRSDLSQKLEVAQGKTRGLEDKLDSLERQSSDDKQSISMLEAKVTDMTRLLRDREGTLDQQQELLAHDRDIRDLMGARDLYVAEVYDVERTGETRKPYGRVFYTKGKSLIFYAYDLDQQPGVKNASTFQAWGRRGPDRQQALSLGVFYVDNASKKRWVLRFDDPKTLAQIDAVFVTVEPNGGSHKPSDKPLLFAYLHIDSNHP